MIAALALLAAGAAAAEQPICADRPAKGNGVCTVPAGKAQIEIGLADWSVTKAGGARTGVVSLGATYFKLGLSQSSDIEVGIAPFTRVTAETGNSRDRVSGCGDIQIRYKQRLTRDDAKVQVAAIPFLKLPTANHDLGNGKVEGGLAVPISFTLSGPVSMTLGPEADLFEDATGHGRHLAVANLVNVSGPIAPNVTLTGELWAARNYDPLGTIRQASADIAFAYTPSNDLQLDAGFNFGLTRETSDAEAYAGISTRF